MPKEPVFSSFQQCLLVTVYWLVDVGNSTGVELLLALLLTAAEVTASVVVSFGISFIFLDNVVVAGGAFVVIVMAEL